MWWNNGRLQNVTRPALKLPESSRAAQLDVPFTPRTQDQTAQYLSYSSSTLSHPPAARYISTQRPRPRQRSEPGGPSAFSSYAAPLGPANASSPWLFRQADDKSPAWLPLSVAHPIGQRSIRPTCTFDSTPSHRRPTIISVHRSPEMSAAGDGAASAPIDVASLPADQSPAVSESTFLRLQKQRPLSSIPRSRPGDINVTEPATKNIDPTQSVPPHSTAEPSPGSLGQAAATPRRSSSPYNAASSPYGNISSLSPARHLSPATSQIFERDVQESLTAPENSPAIPSHITTEDHIPPVLEASSEVITNDRINPDEVEIVMHAAHQPAAVSVGGGPALSDPQLVPPAGSDSGMLPLQDEDAPTYGAVDSSDPRLLSFISFADVIHSEQVVTGHDSASFLASPGSVTPSIGGARSPSPVRSPDPGNRVPLSPTRASLLGGEGSPVRGGAASISSGHGVGQYGELNIETMRQTLDRTGSNDLGPVIGTPP